uniref:Putative secreted protein n=1 Tax=Anopheles triannulatus TaxID=58253 RepID=A0A2M4B0U2_9DIPT
MFKLLLLWMALGCSGPIGTERPLDARRLCSSTVSLLTEVVVVVERLDSSSSDTSVGIEPVLMSFRERYLPGADSILVMVAC